MVNHNIVSIVVWWNELWHGCAQWWLNKVKTWKLRHHKTIAKYKIVTIWLWEALQFIRLAVLCLTYIYQASVCSAISSASSTSMPRYLTVLSSFVWPSSDFVSLSNFLCACISMLLWFFTSNVCHSHLSIILFETPRDLTMRAYCLVVRCSPRFERLGKRKSLFLRFLRKSRLKEILLFEQLFRIVQVVRFFVALR